MKGLRLFIPPFAPDQSGAANVLSALHGMIVILDAGGCAGNICGFDEPRWFENKSAILSAGLRDMDAILGRDDRLVEKIQKACSKIKAEFVAVIGTPVPAVIATDYRAVGRMIEKRTGLPALMIDTDGTGYYDRGEKKAWDVLVRHYAAQDLKMEPAREDTVGVLGLTPLSFAGDFSEETIRRIKETIKQKENCETVLLYGISDSMDAVAAVRKNIVVSQPAVSAATFLKKEYGIPYEIWCDPAWICDLDDKIAALQTKEYHKILIVHQQVAANALKKKLSKYTKADICVAGWFDTEPSPRLEEEDEWISLVKEGDFDLIIADRLLSQGLKDYRGDWWDYPHFALSGKK